MLYRRVRSKCNGEQYRLTTGQQPQPENIDVSGLGDYVVTAVGANGFTVAGNPVTIGVFPNNDIRGLARFAGAAVGGTNNRIISNMLGEQERFRLVTECVKHYTRDSTAAGNKLSPLYTKYSTDDICK